MTEIDNGQLDMLLSHGTCVSEYHCQSFQTPQKVGDEFILKPLRSIGGVNDEVMKRKMRV